MLRLAGIFYTLASTTLAGIFIIVVLTTNMVTLQAIIWAAVAGFAVAVPVAYVLARKFTAPA